MEVQMVYVPEIRLMRERCVLCGDCLKLCPQSGRGIDNPVFAPAGDGGEVRVNNREGCIACFTCVEYCRATAIFISPELQAHDDQPPVYPERPLNRLL